MLAGIVIFICGAIPAVLGYYYIEFRVPGLDATAIENLKGQPGGEAIANCAIASTALNAQAAAVMAGLVTVIKWQSAFSLICGAVVLICCGLLLRQSMARTPV